MSATTKTTYCLESDRGGGCSADLEQVLAAFRGTEFLADILSREGVRTRTIKGSAEDGTKALLNAIADVTRDGGWIEIHPEKGYKVPSGAGLDIPDASVYSIQTQADI